LTQAFVGLGSNVGDRFANLRRAVSALAATEGVTVVRASSVYDTDPVGDVAQSDFLNAVLEIDTGLSPRELLDLFKAIEEAGGRIPRTRWGPREIDLDLLTYGRERIDEPGLRVPHPEMGKRPFVLIPLGDVLPSLDVSAVDRSGVRKAGGDLLAD
jgi:2-amino-4-hydroxy-6-hydroxymethyldihydropteridine diphosphokinase